jgi:L-lactate dehydrogenase complex protein LldF
MQIEPFPERYRRALADEQVQRNLLVFQRNWVIQRDLTMTSEGIDFETERTALAAMKDEVIRNLPNYLDRFESQLRSRGGIVYRAETGDDAIRYIADLAVRAGVKEVVKSKSMVSEEVALNAGLEAAGIDVVETDLGEWLVQLAGERPSHIIGPALHKNRFQTAEILSRFAGQDLAGEDIAAQVQVARKHLRERFLRGRIGISGANALVAETGTVVIVTNEGNAELVTSIPPIHVVLVGMEKLVPTLDDAASVLRLLTPSATGQPASAYVSWITGPTAPDQELHVIVLDNGRTAMREAPLYADALRCIRCGACSNICPSYGVVGGHVFGYVYSGAIGLVNTPFHHGIEHDTGPQSLCVQCNACQTVCPVDIPLPRQILGNREWTVREEGMPLVERLALELWSRPRLFDLAVRAGSILQRPWEGDGYLRPPKLGSLPVPHSLPAISSSPFRDRWPFKVDALRPPLGTTLKGVTVVYFVQCVTDRCAPEMGQAVVEILAGLGAEVLFPGAQHCCGLPAIDAGDPVRAMRMARQTIATLEACKADYIVTGAASCAVAAIHDYPHLFEGEPEWQMRARRLTGRLYDLTSFLQRVARLPTGCLAGAPRQATYHYFCQSYNVLGMRDEPAQLLEDVCGLELVPLPEATWCCGFGGQTSIFRPEISERIRARKLSHVASTGAPLLVTDNPGCILHLRQGLAEAGSPVRVMHTAEVVAERVREQRATR